jgi:hypothetical protein
MKTRIGWFIAALVGVLILIPVSISVYEDWQVYKEGSIVKVVVTALPNNQFSTSGFLKFKLNGKPYDKKVQQNVVNYVHVGDSIKLRFLERYEDHALFPDENPSLWGGFVIVMLISLSGACVYYGSKKEPPEIKIYGRKIV